MPEFLWTILYVVVVWLPWITLAVTLGLGLVCAALTLRIRRGEKQGAPVEDLVQTKERLMKALFVFILICGGLWVFRSMVFGAAGSYPGA